MSQLPQSIPHRLRSGFTLVELMVVIMIIAILSGIVLTAIGTGNEQRAVDSGINKMKSLFTLAQSAAISRNVTTRVLIHADPADQDLYLRYATIVYPVEVSPGNIVWTPYIDGDFLPDGVYFSPALSTGGASPALQVWSLDFDRNSLSFTNPGSVQDSGADQLAEAADKDPIADKGNNVWYMYEFNPNGTFTNPLARFVIASGIVVGDEILFPKENDVSSPYETAKGFVIFRSGSIMFFQEPDQMKAIN